MATIKQEMVFRAVVNGSTITKAMTDAGYSLETSKRTNKVTATKGWQELMDKHLPDSLIAKKHKALLNKKERIMKFNAGTGEYEAIETGDIDTGAVSKALDMAYKLKGSYAPEKRAIVTVNVDVQTKERLDNLLKEAL